MMMMLMMMMMPPPPVTHQIGENFDQSWKFLRHSVQHGLEGDGQADGWAAHFPNTPPSRGRAVKKL